MKKFLLTILLTVFLVPVVYADEEVEYVEVMQQDYIAVKNVTSSTGGCLDYNCTTNGAPTDSTLKKYYYYNDIETFLKSSKNKAIFDRLYEELDINYELNYKTNYPYKRLRVVILSTSSSKFNLGVLGLDLVVSSVNDIYSQDDYPTSGFRNTIHLYNFYNLGNYLGISSLSTDQYTPNYCYGTRGNNPGQFCPASLFSNFPLKVGTGDFATTWFYMPLNYYASNYDYILKNVTTHFTAYDKAKKPVFEDITAGDIVPPLTTFPRPVAYTTINLNDYPYVILSLKDYSSTTGFRTTMSVKGQLCLSAGYNYGVNNKTTGVTDYCTDVSDTFKNVDVFINDTDLKNKAVYYITGYNKEIDNIVKVDSDIFNIHYISEENKDNPSIVIDGKTYNIIPYDQMESNATINTDKGYVPGSSCQVGDLNCNNNTNYPDKADFSNIFSKPLEFFKAISTSISTFFSLITSFIGFLPGELQAFLYLAFTIAIVLGIIKIIL